MESSATGLYKLDFDEAQNIAALVNFDVMLYARKLRSCGPGCDYFSKDKKYFITMLLHHIRKLMQEEALAPEVSAWFERAAAAEEESKEIEKDYLELRFGKISAEFRVTSAECGQHWGCDSGFGACDSGKRK